MQLSTLQILNLARAKLLELTPEILSDTTLLLYANLAQDDLVKRTFTNDQIKTATVAFTNGVGTLPTDFGTLYNDAYDVNNFYPELNIDDFTKGTLERSVTIEDGTIKVYPVNTSSLDIKYYANVTALTSGSTSTLNSYLHECLVYGVVYRALEDLQDEEKSTFYKGKYETELAMKMAILSNYEEANQDNNTLLNYQRLI